MNTSSQRIGIAAGVVVAVTAAVLLSRSSGAAEIVRGADVAVSCGPAQRAVVRQTLDAGKPHVDIQCVPGAPAQAASYTLDESGRLVETPAAYGPAPVASPGFAPAVYQPQVATAPVRYVERAPAPSRVQAAPAASRVRKSTSWQRRALVIGGLAGAGAGVGALIGGKKGALIGAAVGGGGAAVVDALKNR